MSLEEIEQALQQRLDHMAKMDDYPIEDWLRTYEVLAQVKQAQHLEFIARVVDGMGKDMTAVALSDPFWSEEHNLLNEND